MPACLGPAAAPALDAPGTGGAKSPPGPSLRDTHSAPRGRARSPGPALGAGPGRAGRGAGCPGRCVSSPTAELRRLLPPCEPLPPELARASAGQDLRREGELFTRPPIRGLGAEPRQDPWSPQGPRSVGSAPRRGAGRTGRGRRRLGREARCGGSTGVPVSAGRGRHSPPRPPSHTAAEGRPSGGCPPPPWYQTGLNRERAGALQLSSWDLESESRSPARRRRGCQCLDDGSGPSVGAAGGAAFRWFPA